MDFRDIFRSFFGLHPRPDSNNLPPPPRQDWFGPLPEDVFVGDVFHKMEEMVQEMEQSFKDMDAFFQDMHTDLFSGSEGFLRPPTLGPFGNNDGLSSLPPPEKKGSDENLRDLVLKKPDSHKEQAVIDKSTKRDKDLDELMEKSRLPLSEFPAPPKEDERLGSSRDVGTVTELPGTGWKGSFQRFYSTHTFKNGVWEGKTVKENPEGKEITTYTRDDKGELKETTEFIPNTERDDNNNGAMLPMDKFNEGRLFSPFQFFDRFFKPRL